MLPSRRRVAFFPSAFRSPLVRSKRERDCCSCNIRYTWAQAEMWITGRLYCGYHPEYLEQKTREEIEISRITRQYCPCFLEFCLRILGNLRRSGQFSTFPSNLEVNITDNIKIGPKSFERNFSMSQKFQDGTVVGRYGTDPDISRKIAQSKDLDNEMQERLKDLRTEFHEEAEFQYQENEQAMVESRNDPTRSEYPRSSFRAPSRSYYEPSETESRRSNRSYDTRIQSSYRDNYAPNNDTSSTIYPGDSISKSGSQSRGRSRHSLSRFRAASPPGTTNQANDGLSSRASSNRVPFPEPPRRRRDSRPPVSFKMRGFGEVIIGMEERTRRSRSSARTESTSRDHNAEDRLRYSGSRARNEWMFRDQRGSGRVEEPPRRSRSRERNESRDGRDRQSRQRHTEREDKAHRDSYNHDEYDQARPQRSPSRRRSNQQPEHRSSQRQRSPSSHRSHQQQYDRTSQRHGGPDMYGGCGQSERDSHNTRNDRRYKEYRDSSRGRR